MYKLRMRHARVDFGNESFGDVNIEEDVLLRAKSIKDLLSDLKTYLTDRQGEIVEIVNDNITFDTKELTVSAVVERDDESDLSITEEAEIELNK